MSDLLKGKKVVISGAGLVGSLEAIFLAKRGAKVRVYEKRPDMRVRVVDGGRSINLAISTRGLEALAEVGLKEKVLAEAVPMFGRMIHAKDGKTSFQPYSKDGKQAINSISRSGLNKILMTHAESEYGVQFDFEKRLESVDFETGRLRFVDEAGGEDVFVDSELVIGSDGASSVLRNEMERQGHTKCSVDFLEHGYKELSIQPGESGSFRMEKNCLHIWPRGQYMLIALPNSDGSFTCTLFLPYKGQKSFESLSNLEKVATFFNEEFSDVVSLLENLEDEFFTNSTGNLATVRTDQWDYKGRFLLLGDAAHAIVPFFGQGMNCGFEDCSVLEEMMAMGGDLSKVVSDFAALRVKNANAIADMALENFIEMRDSVGNKKFLLQKEVERFLEREFSADYVSRYSLVSFSRVPYAEAYAIGQVQKEVLEELTTGIDSFEKLDQKLAEKLVKEKVRPQMKLRQLN